MFDHILQKNQAVSLQQGRRIDQHTAMLLRTFAVDITLEISMNQFTFESEYVSNEHRRALYEELLDYLKLLKQYLSPYDLVVFGSFISDKTLPNDIDLILHGHVRNGMLGTFNVERFRSRGKLHIKLEISAMKQDFELRAPAELVQWFESSNAGKKVGQYEAIDF